MSVDSKQEKYKIVQDEVRKITDGMLALLSPSQAKYMKEVLDFRSSLTDETPRGAVLMAAAFLDDRLKLLLVSRLVDNKTAIKTIFDFNGALGTFSARINFSYLLGLIPKNAQTDLHTIRAIRNLFAHSAAPLAYEDEFVAKLCNKLKFHGVRSEAPPGAKFRRSTMALLTFILIAVEKTEHIVPIDNYAIPDRAEAYETVSTIFESITGEEYPIKSHHE